MVHIPRSLLGEIDQGVVHVEDLLGLSPLLDRGVLVLLVLVLVHGSLPMLD